MAKDEPRSAGRAATETMQRSLDAGTQALRRAGQAATDQARQATESAGEAASTLHEGTRSAIDEMQALLRFPTAAIGGLQEITQTWSNVLQQAMEANTRFSQDLLGCRTLQDVIGLQGRFVRESLAGLREGSAEMLRAASRIAEGTADQSESDEDDGDEGASTVGEVMSRNVRVVGPDDTIEEVTKVMARADTGVLPVGENDRLVGMLTDRDIAVRLVAQGKNPAQTKVHEVMTAEVKYCFEDEDLEHVAENMAEQRLRRLPVLNREKRLVGILSVGDLATEVSPKLAGRALGGIAQEGGPHRQRLPRGAHANAGAKPRAKRGRGRPAKNGRKKG